MDAINTQPTPLIELSKLAENKWEHERQAFLRLLPGLLTKSRNQYVAVHGGRVVERGDRLAEVALRAYQKHGYVPIYVGLVTDQRASPVRFPSPRRAV
jgi:hypothetical protein